jgi:hypothetical protein
MVKRLSSLRLEKPPKEVEEVMQGKPLQKEKQKGGKKKDDQSSAS